ncbi:PTS transporter subunit EIIC [Bacillus sp. FJAT-49736]|uniref:PTS sugar transporter subunit IIC n=1 Tax=Bacillus sp. FJAT-49736 TaxID=2833582 RepID=UPI001BCA08E7|nr:PTS transporter subunit EIIC [Bacillus sp. FJAT-49736]MBS4174561.1 PTS sugar transporter subunit IIC [Bacillus sp. FJAT-49736]
MNFIDRFMSVAGKIGNNRHLLAIRDALIGMIAITMIGSFAVLVNNLGQVIKPWGKLLTAIFGPNYTTLGGDIWFGTMAFITVFAVFGIANRLARSYGDDGFEAMFIAAACFFLLLPQVAKVEGVKDGVWGLIGVGYLNSTALFTGIVVALLSTEVFVRLSKVKYLVIKLPEGVPPAVARSFAKLLPGMGTIFIFGVVGLLFRKATGGEYFNDWLNAVLVAPMSKAVDSLPFAILLVLLVHLFWSFGLHGTNILAGITTPLFTKLGNENIDLAAKHVTDLKQYSVLAGSFLDAFVYLGGAGATLGLLIAMFIAGRKRHKQMLALGMPPGIFQINEPVLFGMPIVLNPMWIIPFILTPVVTTIIAYLAVSWHWVYPVVANIPWVSPPIVGGWLATGGHISGAVLAGVNLIISVVIYLPFVYAHAHIENKKLKAENSDSELKIS